MAGFACGSVRNVPGREWRVAARWNRHNCRHAGKRRIGYASAVAGRTAGGNAGVAELAIGEGHARSHWRGECATRINVAYLTCCGTKRDVGNPGARWRFD